MLYISPDHRHNEEKVLMLLQHKDIDIQQIQSYLETSLHRDLQELELLKPVLSTNEVLEKKISLCQVEILLSSIRRQNLRQLRS
jgi:hypothetical protein